MKECRKRAQSSFGSKIRQVFVDIIDCDDLGLDEDSPHVLFVLRCRVLKNSVHIVYQVLLDIRHSEGLKYHYHISSFPRKHIGPPIHMKPTR